MPEASHIYAFDKANNITRYVVPTITLSPIWNAILPDGLNTIQREAFMGSGFSSVFIPSGVIEIKEKAFSDCKQLKMISIPASIHTIAQDAFAEVPGGLTIYGEKGSYAEYFAEKNGYTFISSSQGDGSH